MRRRYPTARKVITKQRRRAHTKRAVSIGPRTTRSQLATKITKALEDDGDRPILVGGAVVDIYTSGRHRSDDLDIVTDKSNKQLAPVMEEMGFAKRGSYWEHPKTELLVQFIDSPAMVGVKHIKKPHRRRTRTGILPMVSAADIACDRLAWYMNGSEQSFKQCVDVIVKQKVPLAEVSAWFKNEGWSKPRKEAAMARLRDAVALKRKKRHRR